MISLVKKGNVSSGIAAIGNLVIAVIKIIVAIISGNGTMYATAMHSFADTVNQTFVYIGSVLAEIEPTKRFPTGFGRVINLVCMVAVIVVTIMAYETIKNGWKLWINPQQSTDFTLNIIVLLFSFIIDGYILLKTMRLILVETKVNEHGNLFLLAFTHVKKATPATKLVFYEDIVATLGAVFAIVGTVLSQKFQLLEADGFVSMIIGVFMLIIAFRVGYDNMMGLIGVAAPAEVEERVGKILLSDSCVVDIYDMRIVQEGRAYHVEVTVELKKGLTLDEADDMKFKLSDELLKESDITDVVVAVIEDDDKRTWKNGG